MAADGSIKISVDMDDSNLEKELAEFHKTVEKSNSILSKSFTSTFSAITNSVGRVLQPILDISVAGAKALTNLSVDALKLGADLEQGIGGAKAVFGEFADIVKAKGATAFKEMGLSASDFMATANKMGALMQGSGLSIEQSMDLSTQAMQRAADVASIMGIDVNFAMESVAGAAKGNMTMMDNLGVAMNATTLEAYALSKGIETTYKEMDNAQKVTLAMEMFLEKTAYAAHNYANENETLTGALTTAKAAMENFLSGAGDVDSLVESFTNLTSVIIDNLQELLPRLTTGLSEIVQKLSPEIPEMLSELLPAVIEGITLLTDGLVSAMPEVIKAFTEALPDMSEAGTAILTSIAEGIENSAPILIDGVSKITPEIIKDIEKMLPLLVDVGTSIIEMIIEGSTEMLPELLPVAVSAILTFADAIISNSDKILDAGFEMLEALNDGLMDSVPILLEKAPEIIQKLINAIVKEAPKLFAASFEINTKLAEGIIDNLPEIGYAAGYIIYSVVKGVSDYIQNVVQIGEDIVTNIFNGISGKGEWLSEKSKKFLEEFSLGLRGFAKESGGFGRVLSESMEEAYKKSKQWMKDYQKSVYYSTEEELARWNMLAKNYAGYSEGKIEIDENIARVRKKLADEEARNEKERQQEEDKNSKAREQSKKDFYNNEVLRIKDYRNQADYLIEGEIAKWEELAKHFTDLSNEKVEIEKNIVSLRKKLADDQAKGIKSALKSEEAAIREREKAEKDFYDNAKLWIEDYRTSTEYTVENEIAMWEELLKNYEEFSKERVEIQKNINKLNDQLLKDQQKAEEEATKEREKLEKSVMESLKARNEEMLEIEQYLLDRQIQANKEATDEIIKEYQRQYDEKIKLIDEASQAEIRALQEQLDALDEQEQTDKAYANLKKLNELNQAVMKARTGDGDLAKALEAYNKEVERQAQERKDAETKARRESLKAEIEGVKEANKQKAQLMKDAQEASAKVSDEEIAYRQKVADMEIQIASTKNEELKKLLQEDLDNYKQAHDEKAALVKGDTAYLQFDKTIKQLEKQLGEARTDAEKARIQKQLDEIQSFKDEFFNNVTLMDQQAKNLIEQAQEEVHLNKMKEIRKQQYAEMNTTENLEAEARLLTLKGNEDAVIALLSKYNDDWKQQGKDHAVSYSDSIKEEFADLTAYVKETMDTISKIAVKTETSKETGLVEALKKDLSESEQYIPKYRSLGEMLSDAFTSGFSTIQTMMAEMIVSAAEDANSGVEVVLSSIRTGNDEIMEVFGEYKPKWKESGISLIDYLLEGANFNRLLDKAREAMEELRKIINGGEEKIEMVDESGNVMTEAQWEFQRKQAILQSQFILTSPLNANAGSETSGRGGITIEKQEININQPNPTPSEITRAVNDANARLAAQSGLLV